MVEFLNGICNIALHFSDGVLPWDGMHRAGIHTAELVEEEVSPKSPRVRVDFSR